MQGKVALVTGAGSGIGRATALAMAREGAAVVCADRNRRSADETAARARAAGGTKEAVDLDVASETGWQAAAAHLRTRHGRLDVLVNAAGVSAARPAAEMTPEELRQVMAVNFEGAFLGVKHMLPLLRAAARGAAGGGASIVNVSSASGVRPAAGASACASKAALTL